MHEATALSLERIADATIQTGSRSFSWASRIYGREKRVASHLLYAWCRHCDDAIDDAKSPQQALREWDRISDQTARALKGERLDHHAFEAIHHIAKTYRVPHIHFYEFLEGMRMDLTEHRYADEERLRLYCYGVAGVVGVMMAYVMGMKSDRAISHAADMGRAMQMTNIARDVGDDFALGRVYLPATWMREVGLSADQVMDPSRRKDLALVVGRLLNWADDHYARGFGGLQFLSKRSALTIAVAAEVYRSIGSVIRKRGERAWDTRSYTTRFQKVLASGRGVNKWLHFQGGV